MGLLRRWVRCVRGRRCPRVCRGWIRGCVRVAVRFIRLVRVMRQERWFQVMTDDELEAIRARAEAAAPGPWEAEIGAEIEVNAGSARTTWDGDIGRPATSWRSVDRILEVADADEELDDDEYEIVSANAEFIAHARDDIPALLDEVFRLRALVGEPEWEYGWETKWGPIRGFSREEAEQRAAELRESIAAGREWGDLRYHGQLLRRRYPVYFNWEPVPETGDDRG